MTNSNSQQTRNTHPSNGHLIIKSIGTATPQICASIAQDLDMPPELFLRAVFQAPTILFESIDIDSAEKLSETLRKTGICADVCQAAPQNEVKLYDIAMSMGSMKACDIVFAELANFIGTSANEVVRLMSEAPGVILGDVSMATVEALQDRMAGFDVQVMSACKTDSLYDLFLTESDIFTQRYLKENLGDVLEVLANGGVMCRGLDHDRMEKIWARMRSIKGLKVVNQAFEHWDIYLDGGQKSSTALKTLSETCSIPAEVCEDLLDHCPIVISENVLNANLKDTLKTLTEVGLTARAELTTFQHSRVTLMETSEPKRCLAFLQTLGLAAPTQTRLQMPMILPQALPNFDARMLCNKLRHLGCSYEMEILA